MSFLSWGKDEHNPERPVTRSVQKKLEKTEQRKAADSEAEGDSDNFEEARDIIEINMAPYDQENGTDGEGATKAVFNIKQECDPKKIRMWFQILENKMQFAQIKAQWTKLQVLTTVLPAELLTHIEAFAAVPQASAGSKCYYEAKSRLMDIYGDKPHESYEKAIGLVIVTTPSELARRIIDLICDHKQKPLKECCCAKVVMGIWLRQLSPQVKQAISHRQLEEGNMEETFRVADAVHRSVQASESPITHKVAEVNNPDETLPALDPVAALRQARGRGTPNRRYRGNRGYRGRNNTNPQQGRQSYQPSWGPRHADNPPQSSCRQHWRFGKTAYYCRGTDSSPCPWKEYCIPPFNG